MAAGESKRAFPYNLMTEKSLLRIGGKPIIRHIVDRILTSFTGFTMVRICILNKHWNDFVWEFRDEPDQVGLHSVDKPLGTAGHYLQAAKDFDIKDDEDILLHYADSMTNIDYGKMYEHYKEMKSDCMLAVVPIRHDYSEVKYVWKDKVETFNEKPFLEHPTWTGVAMFKHGVVKQTIGDWDKPDFAHDVFPSIIACDGTIHVYHHEGYYYDTGNAASYNKLVEEYLKSERIA